MDATAGQQPPSGRLGRWMRFVLGGGNRRPLASVTIAIALIIIFGFERLSGAWQHDVTNLRHAWGWSQLDVRDGQWWRLLTPALLHSDVRSSFGPLGFEHLIANVFSLGLFAPRVERRYGPVVLVAAFVAIHVAAYSAWAVTQTTGSYFGIGASGAIVGLAAAGVVGAFRTREWAYAATATAFSVWWWWPDGFTSSAQVHLAGALAGVVFGVFATWPKAILAALGIAGAGLVFVTDPRLPPRPRTAACPDRAYDSTSDQPQRFLLRNPLPESIDVYWVRPNGSRDFIATLDRDGYLVEDSFVGAHFVITTDRGVCEVVVEVR